MTAASARSTQLIILMTVWTIAAFYFAAVASEVQQPSHSFIDRLNSLKQLLNAEQVVYYYPVLLLC